MKLSKELTLNNLLMNLVRNKQSSSSCEHQISLVENKKLVLNICSKIVTNLNKLLSTSDILNQNPKHYDVTCTS